MIAYIIWQPQKICYKQMFSQLITHKIIPFFTHKKFNQKINGKLSTKNKSLPIKTPTLKSPQKGKSPTKKESYLQKRKVSHWNVFTTHKFDPKKPTKKRKSTIPPKLITNKKTKLSEYAINMNKLEIFFNFVKLF